MSEDAKASRTLPYGPFKGWKGFLSRMKATAIPPRIDNSVMKGMSGSARSEIRIALRDFGLIDSADTVLPAMRKVVDALDTPRWRAPQVCQVY